MNASARLLSTGLMIAAAWSSSAACVGPLSYGIPIVPGVNFIANQLNCGGNTVPEIMPPGLPEGTRVTKFDKATGTYQITTYIEGAWEGDPVTLNPGDGAILYNPGAVGFLLTLGGTLNIPMLPVILPPGSCCLLSRQTAAVGTYETIVGTAPPEGVTMLQWNPTTGTYDSDTYTEGAWTGDSGGAAPLVDIGESVWICTPSLPFELCATIPKWSQRPGYLLFPAAPDMHGGNRPSDVDWTLLMQTTNIIQPNWVIADDFRSDGRPIISLRWWGSYFPGFTNGFEDGFAISFFSDVPGVSNQFGLFSRPGNLLGTYLAPFSAVRVRDAFYRGWDGHEIFQYEVNLKDTCLDHAVTNLATPRAFLERSNVIYWLAITAEVGHRIIAETNRNGVITNWFEEPTHKRATNHFWGWHTSPTNWNDASVMGNLIMSGQNWIYPPDRWRSNAVFHMERDQAFELLTAPVLVSAGWEGTNVIVVFREPMDPASASNPANYTITGGVGAPSVLSATLLGDGTTVLLRVNGLFCDVRYRIAVSGVFTAAGVRIDPDPSYFDFFCPCAPKVAKWSQLPGFLLFTNDFDLHGGNRASDFDWMRIMTNGDFFPVIAAIYEPPGPPYPTAVAVSTAVAQTFTVTVTGTVERLDLPICRFSPTAPDLIVELRRTVLGVPTSPSTPPLGSVTLPSQQIPEEPTWVGVLFPSNQVPIVAGEYAVVLRTTQATTQTNYLWFGENTNPYAAGSAFRRTLPPNDQWLRLSSTDLGFCIIVVTPDLGTNIVQPNWIIADDFRSDGRPIQCVRWWGSYLHHHTNGFEDAFVLSFFSDIPVSPTNEFSQPGDLLGTYIAPYSSVRATNTHWLGWDGHEIWCYEVDLRDTCLDHARSGIATPAAFLERSNIIYWLSIAAEVGHGIRGVTNHQGVVTNWIQYPTDKCACDSKHFWGWHTSPTNWNDACVMGHLFMDGHDWIYDLWMPNDFFHMELDQAFELLTDPNGRPPCGPSPVLSIARVPGGVMLSWAAPDYCLESAASLPGVWAPVPGASPVFVPLGPGNLFFRLVCPCP
jgi:hypothetical protein